MEKYIYHMDENSTMSSLYRRELTNNEIGSLKKTYEKHARSIARGFLTREQRMRLLELKKKERGTTDSDFWYKLKRQSKNAIMELQMISDIANDKQLKEIFYEGTPTRSPISELFVSLFPINRKTDQDDLWRSSIMAQIVFRSLEWYLQNNTFPTESHQRLIRDTLDAISVTVYGVPYDAQDGIYNR